MSAVTIFSFGLRDAWPRRAKRGRGQVGATLLVGKPRSGRRALSVTTAGARGRAEGREAAKARARHQISKKNSDALRPSACLSEEASSDLSHPGRGLIPAPAQFGNTCWVCNHPTPFFWYCRSALVKLQAERKAGHP